MDTYVGQLVRFTAKNIAAEMTAFAGAVNRFTQRTLVAVLNAWRAYTYVIWSHFEPLPNHQFNVMAQNSAFEADSVNTATNTTESNSDFTARRTNAQFKVTQP
jgi:hypothetical protein